jgi:hypothetical protein
MLSSVLLTASLVPYSTNAQVPNYVPTNGLVGWWPFNGNAQDESGNGNNGTVNGATLTTDRFGIANKAYSFDGNSIIEVIHSNLFDISTEATFSIWLKYSTMSNTVNFIMQKGSGHGCNISGYQITFDYGYGTIQNASKGLGYGIGQNNYCASIADTSYLDSTWHNIIIVYSNPNSHELFFDGVSMNGGDFTQCSNCIIQNTTSPLIIGGFSSANTGNNWFGKLDDIGIWNRALTACEVQDLYNSELNSLAVSGGPDQELCVGQSTSLFGTGANTYQWSNNIQNGVGFVPTATNSYILIGTDANGCVGTDTVTVTVNEVSSSTQTQTALDSYTWPVNGQTYLESGTYTAVIPNAAGCDSTITLELTLNFTGIESLQFNATKTLIKITDLNGKETPFKKNTVLLFIYEDGTVERVFEAE